MAKSLSQALIYLLATIQELVHCEIGRQRLLPAVDGYLEAHVTLVDVDKGKTSLSGAGKCDDERRCAIVGSGEEGVDLHHEGTEHWLLRATLRCQPYQ